MPPKCSKCGQHYWTEHPCDGKAEASPSSTEQPVDSPIELLKLLGYVNAMIGYCQSLKAGTVISESYLQRMNDHYIPNTQKACMLIAKLLDRASVTERESVGRNELAEFLKLHEHTALLHVGDGVYRPKEQVDYLMERYDIRRRG